MIGVRLHHARCLCLQVARMPYFSYLTVRHLAPTFSRPWLDVTSRTLCMVRHFQSARLVRSLIIFACFKAQPWPIGSLADQRRVRIMQVLHLYETFGWWRTGGLRAVHFAEECAAFARSTSCAATSCVCSSCAATSIIAGRSAAAARGVLFCLPRVGCLPSAARPCTFSCRMV